MSNVLHPNQKEFTEILNQNEVVFVDFFASWCGPCKMLAPEIEKLADAYQGKAAVVKIDVDKEPALAAQFRVQSIPSLFVIKHNKVVNQAMGFQPYPKLIQLLEQ